MFEPVPCFRVLGVRVDAVQIPDAIAVMKEWIEQGTRNFITVTGMHGVTEAQSDPSLKTVFNEAGLVVPDGMPLVWLGRRKGFPLPRRVYGPELMATFCATTGPTYKHFLYGAGPGVAEELSEVMRVKWGSITVGTYCPPFRTLTDSESEEIIRLLNDSKADVVWVGLSTPKQEQWMHEFRDRVNASVFVGVGTAFDFLTDRKRSAPGWMRENGLEWLFRLVSEPRRLWRRYLVGGSKFVWWNALERFGFRSFD